MYKIWIALAVCALPALPSGFQSSDFLKLRAVGTGQFSPDGARIAYSITRNDGPRRPFGQLWIRTLADGNSICLSSGNDPSSDPEWSPDGKQIAFVRIPAHAQDVFYWQRTGQPWFVVTTIVEDSQYLQEPFVTSSNFKKQSDAAGWKPRPCSAR